MFGQYKVYGLFCPVKTMFSMLDSSMKCIYMAYNLRVGESGLFMIHRSVFLCLDRYIHSSIRSHSNSGSLPFSGCLL